MTVPYKLDDAVLLSREREGIIRYIGNVHFSKGIWCGIELIGGSVGTNDGKMEGHRYFTCSRNRGLFCKIGKVRRKFREKDHSATSRQKRKASLEQRLFHQTLQSSTIQSELKLKNKLNHKHKNHNNLPNDRYFSKGKPSNNTIPSNIQITSKRNSRKQRSQTTPFSNNKANWLEERLNHVPRKQRNERARSPKPFKPGPRDIGKISGSNWKPIEYKLNEKETNISWKKERLNTKRNSRIRSKSANTSSNRIYKQGPRDIGRVSGKSWKPIKLSKAEKAKLMNNGEFLEDRIEKRKKGKSSENKIYKQGPRDIGRMHGWKQEKSKKFKIAVEGKEVDPKKLTKSKAKNKQQMKGKKTKNKVKKRKKRNVKNRNQNIDKNKNMFDSFRRVNRRNNNDINKNSMARQSVRVELNKQNQKTKNKNVNVNNIQNKKRQSAQYIKQMKYNKTIQNQRNEAYKNINYGQFTAYKPGGVEEKKIDINENENENDVQQRYKHFSAANESEADFDLDDDGYENIDNVNDKKEEQIVEDKRPSEHIYEIFNDNEINDLNYSDFSDNEIGNNDELKSGSVSPSGHEHMYEGNGNISPSGHDNLFDLFDNNERMDYNKSLPNKPLPPPPPNKPLPNRIKGRIKGITPFVGQWIVSFKHIKPVFVENNKMNIANISKTKRRSSSVARKNYNKNNNGTFTYSIYKDGSVHVQPKMSFGWNGLGNIIFQQINQRFEIHSNNSNEYEYVLINRNGTLHVQHFNYSNNYKTPFIGIGIKG